MATLRTLELLLDGEDEGRAHAGNIARPEMRLAILEDMGRVGKYLIYGLVQPWDGQLRYVGKSSDGLGRPRAHWEQDALRRDTSHCGNWVRKVLRTGTVPGIVVLQDFGNDPSVTDVLGDLEDGWMVYMRQLGFDLTNIRRGGPNGTFSEEGKRRISEGHKNSPLAMAVSRENIKKAHAAAVGKPKSAETRAKISAAQSGKKLAEDHRASLCKPKSRQGCINMSRAHGGKPVVDITTGRVFDSLSAATRELHLNHGNANEVLRGRRNHVRGFIFRYVE